MSEQQLPFVHDFLESKLRERLHAARSVISRLSKENVLQCGSGCLTELVREFVVAPPIARLDLMVADEEVVETVDATFERKTGNTGHIFLIPVERDAKWLEEIDSQRTSVDSAPLAFLDKKRSWISVRLMLSPEDVDGALKQKLNYRSKLVEQYVDSVARKLIEFNKELAEKMTLEMNKRKSSITKAERELEDVGLPRVHNPLHEERTIQIERLMQRLGKYMGGSISLTEKPGRQEVRSFIVHGHDHQSLYELKDYLQNTLKLAEPVILRKMPGLGKTLIEKFESEAEAVELVFVLLTPDDAVAEASEPDAQKRRARQNVILELGFFMGKLGRKSGKILLLHKGPVEIPSDIIGIEYIDITNGIESAGEIIRREIDALGILK
jgi:predicted nucleotide-binding protein